MILFNSDGQGYFHFSYDLDLESTGTMTFVSPSSKTKKRMPAANHLTEIEYNILCKANSNHQRSLDFSKRDKYSLSYLINVTSFVPNKIIEVRFQCGDSFYYTDIGGVC